MDTENELERLLAQREGVSDNTHAFNYEGLSPQTQRQIRKLIEQDAVDKTRTWSWYQKLRKEDPQKYARERRNMQRDAMALGDAFKDGDWKERTY